MMIDEGLNIISSVFVGSEPKTSYVIPGHKLNIFQVLSKSAKSLRSRVGTNIHTQIFVFILYLPVSVI